MRIGVLADVHGHAAALRAVLAALSVRTDRIVCLGDLTDGGGEDEACVAEARARGLPAVLGVHDRRTLERGGAGLTPESAAWLAALPRMRAVEGLHLVHDNPIAPAGLARGMWRAGTYIRHHLAAQVVFAQAEVFRADPHAVVTFGHTHLPAVHTPDEEIRLSEGHPVHLRPGRPYLVNPGAVGYSSDGRAAHAAIWDTTAREFTVLRVETPTLVQAEYRGV